MGGNSQAFCMLPHVRNGLEAAFHILTKALKKELH